MDYTYTKLLSVKEVYCYLGIKEKSKYNKIDGILEEISELDILKIKKPSIAYAAVVELDKRAETIINEIKPETWKQYYSVKNMSTV